MKAPRDKVNAMNAATSFKLFAELRNVQRASSGKGKEANGLPAPVDAFVLTLRMCLPREKAPSILDGSWKIPEVEEVS